MTCNPSDNKRPTRSWMGSRWRILCHSYISALTTTTGLRSKQITHFLRMGLTLGSWQSWRLIITLWASLIWLVNSMWQTTQISFWTRLTWSALICHKFGSGVVSQLTHLKRKEVITWEFSIDPGTFTVTQLLRCKECFLMWSISKTWMIEWS